MLPIIYKRVSGANGVLIAFAYQDLCILIDSHNVTPFCVAEKSC